MTDSSDANVAEERMNNSLKTLFDDFYKKYILPIHRDTYLCSADCCKRFDRREEVSKCTENCNANLLKIYNKIEQESDSLNQALSRCIMTCSDKQRKKTNKEYQMLDLPEKKQYEQEVMKCVTGCFDENIATLPKLQERLQNFMKKL